MTGTVTIMSAACRAGDGVDGDVQRSMAVAKWSANSGLYCISGLQDGVWRGGALACSDGAVALSIFVEYRKYRRQSMLEAAETRWNRRHREVAPIAGATFALLGRLPMLLLH
jgi:hypothetical protein